MGHWGVEMLRILPGRKGHDQRLRGGDLAKHLDAAPLAVDEPVALVRVIGMSPFQPIPFGLDGLREGLFKLHLRWPAVPIGRGTQVAICDQCDCVCIHVILHPFHQLGPAEVRTSVRG